MALEELNQSLSVTYVLFVMTPRLEKQKQTERMPYGDKFGKDARDCYLAKLASINNNDPYARYSKDHSNRNHPQTQYPNVSLSTSTPNFGAVIKPLSEDIPTYSHTSPQF